MKQLVNISIVLAAVSLVVGVFSRATLAPVSGIEANAFLRFADTLLLLAIALSLASKSKD